MCADSKVYHLMHVALTVSNVTFNEYREQFFFIKTKADSVNDANCINKNQREAPNNMSDHTNYGRLPCCDNTLQAVFY